MLSKQVGSKLLYGFSGVKYIPPQSPLIPASTVVGLDRGVRTGAAHGLIFRIEWPGFRIKGFRLRVGITSSR